MGYMGLIIRMKKRLFAIVVFFLMTFAVLGITQEILKAKFVQDSTVIVDGFYAEKKNDIDVLFIGSSNCFCTIDPLVLYEEYGITAYNFASSSQSMDISLLYLKEALKRQKPKVVALEVNYIPGQIVSDLGEDSIMWGLTDMPLTFDKLKCLYQLLGKVDEDYLSYAFPLLRYHERWKEISKQDYTYPGQDKTNWNKGYLRTNEVTIEQVDLSSYTEEGSAWLDERAVVCLKEMVNICKEEGISLVLFKSPKEGWYQYFSSEIASVVAEEGIELLDYNGLAQEIRLDMTMDFRDRHHLNNQGAAKVSFHMGAYLKEHFDIPDRREEIKENSWDMALAYLERQKVTEYSFADTTTVTECKEMMDEKEDYATILTYKGGKDKVQYQWIYVEGEQVFSKVWNEDGITHEKIKDLEVVFVREKKMLNVLIDSENYYNPQKNWSAIIYDLKTNEVVAQLSYDK